MSYRIKTLVHLTGISRNTITAWERRYNLLEPEKDSSGYRVYTDADVTRLRRVKGLLDEGYQIGDVLSMLERDRKRVAPTVAAASGLDGHREALLERLLAFDRVGAEALRAQLLEVPFHRRVDEVYLPILRAAGDGWAGGTISIAQEHFLSSWVREQLLTLLKGIVHEQAPGPRLACAGYPGELHDLGLLAVSIHLALRGYNILYLGPNLPLDELVAVARATDVDMLAVSLVRPRDPAEVLAHATALRSKVDPDVRVVLGGSPVAPLENQSTDNLWFCPSLEAFLARVSDTALRQPA